MGGFDQLLEAVIDAPDEDGPRLACANWLGQHGERVRADFIRLQCFLSTLPADHPERASLDREVQGMLDAHGWEWAEPFGNDISEWQFRRGFVERVTMGLETSAENILGVLRKGPVRHLRDVGQFNDLSAVIESLPALSQLRGLEFWALYAVEDEQMARLLQAPELGNLRTLILHHDRNGNLAPEEIVVSSLFSPLRANLEELAINVDGTWQGMSPAELAALARSPHLRRLRRLNLSNAGLVENRPGMDVETTRMLGNSENLANLEALDLGYCNFPIEVWDEVLKWPFLPRLKYLRLFDCRQVEVGDFRPIADLKEMAPYRAEFEAKVRNIDWETDFILPYLGNASWKGLSWDGRKEQILFSMWPYIERRDYSGLEEAFRRQCVEYAGEEAAKAVDQLRFDLYEAALRPGLEEALVAARRWRDAAAIYLRVDPRSEWRGEFHVSKDPVSTPFVPRRVGVYSRELVKVMAPSFPDAGAVWRRNKHTKLMDPGAVRNYVIARTAAAIGRCVGERRELPVVYDCLYAQFLMSFA